MQTNVISTWNKIVGDTWAEKLNSVLNSQGMNELMTFILREYETALVYPPKEDVFRAFRLCPADKLKVIILGQDPYYDGSATGLAFANNRQTIRMSPSLASIWKECEKATETISVDFDITLENWAKQGVLLLNTALTVKKYQPTAHSTKWHPFTQAVIKVINDNFTGLHFCFWGSHAKGFQHIVNDNLHYKYYANHPIAHVHNGGSGWTCNHFNEINEKITQQNGKDEIIIW